MCVWAVVFQICIFYAVSSMVYSSAWRSLFLIEVNHIRQVDFSNSIVSTVIGYTNAVNVNPTLGGSCSSLRFISNMIFAFIFESIIHRYCVEIYDLALDPAQQMLHFVTATQLWSMNIASSIRFYLCIFILLLLTLIIQFEQKCAVYLVRPCLGCLMDWANMLW
jgi:hypothetical protein